MKNEQYLDAVRKQWGNILRLYNTFEDKKPVMEFDIQNSKIYAFPYKDYGAQLSKRSQIMLKKQYEEALQSNKMVVFIKDSEDRLISVSLDIEASEH